MASVLLDASLACLFKSLALVSDEVYSSTITQGGRECIYGEISVQRLWMQLEESVSFGKQRECVYH